MHIEFYKNILPLAGITTLASGLMLYESQHRPKIPYTKDSQGNVYINPDTKPEYLFVNPPAGDFRLRPGNPGIAAGAPIPEVTTDIDGKPRDPSRPSIGAHESPAKDSVGPPITAFFNAPFTYLVLLMTLITNIASLYLTRKLLKESSQNQFIFLNSIKEYLFKRHGKHRQLPASSAQILVVDKTKQKQEQN